MDKLDKKNYSEIRNLFKGLESFQPMCTTVLDGIWEGDIWVDTLEKPEAALLVTFLPAGGPAWCFLAGKPESAQFIQGLNTLLFDQVGPFRNTPAFLFTCSPEDWSGYLKVIGDPRTPVPMLRHHYLCQEMVYDWRSNLPTGFEIQSMSVDLLCKDDLQIPPQLNATLEKWRSINNPRFRDFGFLMVHDNRVVSWATVDYVSEVSGDLGFETLPEFRQRGLGSTVAGAALEHALEMGIEVHWTCAADNLGSQKTAQKLGFTHDKDYTMHLFARDLTEHRSQLAYSYLARGDYREAIKVYEELFSQEANVPLWAYFDTAQAWAALEDAENALKYLRIAAREGWPAVEMTEKTPEFQFLQNRREWVQIIAQMRKNQKKT